MTADVAGLLRLMQQWREAHPFYHVLIETSGSDVLCSAEVFNFTNDRGEQQTRMKSQMFKPNTLSFVAQAETNRVLAYFPKSNQAVEMFKQEDAKRMLMQMGWTSGGVFEPMSVFKLAKVSFVETAPDFKALTLVFPPQAFQLPPAAGDLFWTIKIDDAGKVLAVEQLTLGNRVVSKLTYFEEDHGRIRSLAPEIPATANRSEKSLRDAIQDEVNVLKNKPSITI